MLLCLGSQCASGALNIFLFTAKEIEGVHEKVNQFLNCQLQIRTAFEKTASLKMLLQTVLNQKPVV